MTISFNEIPKNWLSPLFYCEIDPTRADQSAAAMPYKVLVMGHGDYGTAVNEPQRATSAGQVARLFGKNSLLAAQAGAWFSGNTTTEVYFVGVAEPVGKAAEVKIVFSGTTNGGGNLYVYIAGRRISAYVSAGATAEDAAQAVHAAISHDNVWRSALDEDGRAVIVTAPHAGQYANGVMVRLGYYQGEELPAGLTVSFEGGSDYSGTPTPDYEVSAALAALVAFHGEIDPARPFQSLSIPGMLPPRAGTFGRMGGGTGTPDLSGLFSALGDIHYHLMVSPWVDGYSLQSLKETASGRWHALAEIPVQVICAAGGTHTELGMLGDSHNSEHLTIMGTGGHFTAQENNLLLFDGISTYAVTSDGGCAIQRLVTTYKENAWGAEDKAYRDLNTLLTVSFLRRSLKVWMTQKFPRHKLASDNANFGFGQAIATPQMIRGEALSWLYAMERLGLVENVDQCKDELIVERNADDPCRVDIYLPPDVVNQLRVMATKMGFKL
ncbi:hypothetical protein C4J81_15360 [Deltaproteobacteria bacterium Smac51]|nr:hypothetical protein C4J81_10095 [Deltaproteobacteria bacterium Smac51]UQZ90509.1 hypothetical protein C4J81_15360 [Deltaproteobacteria bacterium Smac51]